jgi:hypothetical protein
LARHRWVIARLTTGVTYDLTLKLLEPEAEDTNAKTKKSMYWTKRVTYLDMLITGCPKHVKYSFIYSLRHMLFSFIYPKIFIYIKNVEICVFR